MHIISKGKSIKRIFSGITIMTQVKIYDTTLRDGTQGEGVNYSKVDKILLRV